MRVYDSREYNKLYSTDYLPPGYPGPTVDRLVLPEIGLFWGYPMYEVLYG